MGRSSYPCIRFLVSLPAYSWLFNFHTFGRTEGRTFVSLDQILVPTHSIRDKGTKGQRDKGTKGQSDKGRKG